MFTKLFLLAVISTAVFASTDKFVCYLGSWANYRNGNCRFTIEDINPYLCTHVIYGFVGLNNDGSIRIMDSWLDEDSGLGALRRFTGLKKKNPNLQTLVAIGGWNEGSVSFSKVVSSPSLRATFISNTIAFLEKYGFDGFDLDWEYPSRREGSQLTDKNNFSKLLAEFRQAFDKHTPRYLLTAAVAASRSSIDVSYDVPQLSKYLDFINVMTYDLHGAWESVTGHNAPLYPRSSETGTVRTLNVDSSITGWIEKGADPQKLILGIPTYGRAFTLSGSNKGLDAAASGSGTAGSCTAEPGYLGYNEICQKLASGGWTIMRDFEHKVPYIYSGNQWIGYDDVESVTLKVEYARSKGLGGAMIWSFETDDFKGLCGPVYPLSNAIKKALSGSPGDSNDFDNYPGNSSSTGDSDSSSSTTTTTTASPSGGYCACTSTGYCRDINNCSVFYQCIGDKQYRLECPSGLHFDEVTTACNYPSLVKC
ncbi:Chitin binding Peritrophin-A domain [Popillia japonica]|uniref:Chitin binding Peritrophin-A domain n=1 Tax=Popillia japonica TaxID=7064 RepID=A0AAW1LVD3_POPJA